jgi:hypothetical protein
VLVGVGEIDVKSLKSVKHNTFAEDRANFCPMHTVDQEGSLFLDNLIELFIEIVFGRICILVILP